MRRSRSASPSFAALPVFVEHKENEVSRAAEQAREGAAEEAAEEDTPTLSS